MNKLLKAWLNHPNANTAIALVKYNNRHMMAACMLTPDEIKLLNEAIAFVKGGCI